MWRNDFDSHFVRSKVVRIELEFNFGTCQALPTAPVEGPRYDFLWLNDVILGNAELEVAPEVFPTVPLENSDLCAKMGFTVVHGFSLLMLIFLATLLATLPSILRSRADLALENLALRHQIGVLQRAARKRPKLTHLDRLLWTWLSRVWSDWRSALTIVQPETVIA